MARSSPSQQSFNAGELSPLLGARVDMAKYGNGCHAMSNFIPLPQGPARRRNGTRFVQECRTSADRSWLVPFVFSPTQAFVLEFGNLYIRFYAPSGGAVLESTKVITGITQANPAVVTSVAHGYANGDQVYISGVLGMTQVNTGPFTVAGVAANTFQLSGINSTGYAAYTSGGTVARVYQITSPYSTASLTNSDGTFALSIEQTGDVLFIGSKTVYPQKLTRIGTTNWTIGNAAITSGPFIDVDPDETRTVYASATTGVVTLTASAAIFTAEKVGTLFLLEQKKIDAYKVWEVAKAIALNAERRSDSNVYQALNAATTGSVKPTHREGARFDGDAGVQWQYLHSGYGIARITAVGGGGTTATATVITALPSDSVGVANASTRWAFSAWDSVLGFPNLVTIHLERLVFMRGTKQWGSVPGDFENFAARDGAETTPDSAYSIDIASKGITDSLWMVSAGALIVGTSGTEVSITQLSTSETFGPGNIQSKKETARGSRQVPPAVVGTSVLFAMATGRRVQNIRYSFDVNGYDTLDMTVLAEHIATGQIIRFAYAQEPHSIVWACCANGDLIALTYLPEQDVMGWHPHSVSGIVESIVVVPDSTGSFDQLWLQVKRTINGVTRRYVEYLEKEWVDAEDELEDALFSDCGATFDGALTGASITLSAATYAAGDMGASTAISGLPIVAGDIGDYLVLRLGGLEARVEVLTVPGPQISVRFITALPVSMQGVAVTDLRWARDVIGGLGYLEGQSLSLIVEGGAHPDVTVTAAQVTLQGRYHKVQIGLPAPCELTTMRIESGASEGTAQGKIKRIHNVTFRLLETLGGKGGAQGAEDRLEFRSSAAPMNAPPTLYTGDIALAWPVGYETDARVRYVNDQPFPVTLMAIYPQMNTENSR